MTSLEPIWNSPQIISVLSVKKIISPYTKNTKWVENKSNIHI